MILQHFPRMFLSGMIIVFLLPACEKIALELDDDGAPSNLIVKLNKNVQGLREMANACMNADSIAFFNIEHNKDGSVYYWLRTKHSDDIVLFSEIVSDEILVPELSMDRVGDLFFWTVNGVFLKDSDGARISVTDMSKPISFVLQKRSIICKVKRSNVGEYPITKANYMAKDISFEYDNDKHSFLICLSSGHSFSLPTTSEFHLLDEIVLNRSFYKDVFLDAGVAMTSRKSLAAAEYLGLSLECISLPYSKASDEQKALQAAIISGDLMDSNGRLLYPDGQPRYRLLFVNGGASVYHGLSLGEKGVGVIHNFVKSGGSYVGTCAGAFLASNGYDDIVNYPYFFSVWPGITQHTRLRNARFGLFIEKDSPLLKYYDFGGDFYVDSVRHNNGGYPLDLPPGTEVLARYDYPNSERFQFYMKPNIWAYKETLRTGRVIMEGSHPEEVPDGERRDLTAAMMLYAMDGVGVASLKGYLKNGEERVMNKKSTDNQPNYTCIGDLQTHHFAAYIPSDAKNIRVELKSSSDCDLALMMSQDSFAFADVAEYSSAVPGANQKLSFPTIREGLWFIAVQCLTTVTVTETDYGQAYGGKTEVLNGVPYKISISWE